MHPQRFLKTLSATALAVGLLGPAQALVIGPGTGGSIPDGVVASTTQINLATASLFQSTITSATAGVISSFNSVTLRGLSHTWAGDLVITLSHGGTTVELLDRLGAGTQTSVGSAGDFLQGDYTFLIGGATLPSQNNVSPGSYAPLTNAAGGKSSADGLLTDFNGMDLLGDWTLTVRDLIADDRGSLASWTFDVTLAQSNPVPEPAGLGLLGLAALGLAQRRRRA